MEANQITDQKNRGIKINKFRIFRYTLISVCAATYFRVFCYIFPGVLLHISGCSATYFWACCYIFPGVLLHISGCAATYFRVCCYVFSVMFLRFWNITEQTTALSSCDLPEYGFSHHKPGFIFGSLGISHYTLVGRL